MTRLVVVGNGMVGSRFVEDLLGADAAGRYDVTVVGAEACEPYNRVLLSEVVAGKHDLSALTLPTPQSPRLTVLRGEHADHVDREDRVVVTADGRRLRYDRLVLATGSAARVPPLPGLRAANDGHETTLGLTAPADQRRPRPAHDRRRAARSSRPRSTPARAVVLGAASSAWRQPAASPDAESPSPSSTPRARSWSASSTRRPAGWSSSPWPHWASTTGSVSAPPRPLVEGGRLRRTAARRRRGGPCRPPRARDGHRAQHGARGERRAHGRPRRRRGRRPPLPRRPPRVRHRRLRPAAGGWHRPGRPGVGAVPPAGCAPVQRRHPRTGPSDAPERASPRPSTSGSDVVRLKAHGLDVVTMGVCGSQRADDPAQRTLRLSDPDVGRHVEVVVSGGLLVGATCVGAGAVAADLVTTYTRRTPVPADPAYLLLPALAPHPAGAPTSPAAIPDDATICRCNGVTKAAIVACVHDGATSVPEVASGDPGDHGLRRVLRRRLRPRRLALATASTRGDTTGHDRQGPLTVRRPAG